MSARLKRVDEGHYLVPDSPYEVVREGSGPWAIYEGNSRVRGVPESRDYYSYDEARRAALKLRASGQEGGRRG